MVGAECGIQPLWQRDFGFPAPGFNLGLGLWREGDGYAVALSGEGGLHQLGLFRLNSLFRSFHLLLDFFNILGRNLDVLRLVFQQAVGLFGQCQEFFRRNMLVAQGHLPVKIQQVFCGKGPEAHAPL